MTFIENELLLQGDLPGWLGSRVTTWRDFIGDQFRRLCPGWRVMPEDVAEDLLEQAASGLDLRVLGEMAATIRGRRDIVRALEAILAAGRDRLNALTLDPRNQDLRALGQRFLERADDCRLVLAAEVPRRAAQALRERPSPNGPPIIGLLLPWEDPGLAAVFEAIEERDGDVTLFGLTAPENLPLPQAQTSLLDRLRECPLLDKARAFVGAAGDTTVQISACPGETDEVRFVIEQIKRGLIDGKWTPPDTAIVVRNPSRYMAALLRASQEYGVPLETLQSRPFTATPLGRFLLLPLTLASKGWERETLSRFFSHTVLEPKLKTICPDWNPGWLTDQLRQAGAGASGQASRDSWERDLDRIERGLSAAESRRATGAIDDEEAPESDDAPRTTDFHGHRAVLAYLFDQLSTIPPEGTPSEYASALTALLDELGVGEALAARAGSEYPGRPEWIQRDFVTRYAFLRALESLEVRRRLVAPEPATLSAAEMDERLRRILDERLLAGGSRPDGAVTVCGPEDLRPTGYRAVFAVGVLHGEYPQPPSLPRLLDEETAEALGRTRNAHRQAERRIIQILLNAAREQLFLSYPHTTDEGRTPLRAAFLDDLLAALTEAGADPKECGVFREYGIRQRVRRTAECASGTALLDALSRDLREGGSAECFSAYNAWREEAARREDWLTFARLAATEAERDSRRPAGPYDGNLRSFDSITRALRSEVAKRTHSASAMNQYAACPAQYFYQRILALAEVEEPDPGLGAREIGLVLHDLLSRFLSPDAPVTFPLQDGDRGAAMNYLNRLADARFRAEAWPERNPYLVQIEFERLRRAFERIVKFECAAENKLLFAPQWLEMDFEDLEIELDGFDQPLRFRGRVDRVDTDPTDEQRFVVIDYKSGRKPSGTLIDKGLDFQLPIYVQAVQARGPSHCVKAYYYAVLNEDAKSREPKRGPYYSDSPADPRWETVTRPLLAARLNAMADGQFVTDPQGDPCKYCDFQRICRYSEARFERKAGDTQEEDGA